MKILESYWFSQMAGTVIGIVKVENKIGEIKYYIGSSLGNSQEDDEKHIAERGAKFPIEAGKILMP
jgi:hypothetical protein